MKTFLVICCVAVLCGANAKPQYDAYMEEAIKQAESYVKFTKAIDTDNVTEVESLIKSGANVNSTSRENSSVLKFAAWKGNEKIVNLLIQNGANVNQNDFYGFGPLQQAVENGHTKIVELLLKSGANVNAHDEFSSVPIHYLRDTDVAIAEMLVNAGADLNAKNIFQQIPSDRIHNEDVLKVLKRKGATSQN